jgi:predicted nuclease with TOPRIM domain
MGGHNTNASLFIELQEKLDAALEELLQAKQDNARLVEEIRAHRQRIRELALENVTNAHRLQSELDASKSTIADLRLKITQLESKRAPSETFSKNKAARFADSSSNRCGFCGSDPDSCGH